MLTFVTAMSRSFERRKLLAEANAAFCSGKSDTQATVEQVRRHNAAYPAVCPKQRLP